MTCPDIAHRTTPFILLEAITRLPQSHQSERQSERQLLECFILISCARCLFPLCLLPSPPSSSGWVAGTSSDRKSLAPSHTGSPFHSTERTLTIISAVSTLLVLTLFVLPSTLPPFLLAYSKSSWSI